MIITARSALELGQAIRRFRKKKNLSQSDVAKTFNLRQATISNLERGGESKKLDILFMVLSSLNLEVSIQEKVPPPEIDEENW
ncbi:helix-turn-helix domain-containing protein [Kangiella taiwanensis]|uniref:HTH cro/C1-type domain-containing protein n=1 Tax=Kangiella taiwanensis TaxID=1079179 RepID=A0ABP8I868_9GAMM|nr:XRE family transcriptional regulator [Kangiella taiwanensis]